MLSHMDNFKSAFAVSFDTISSMSGEDHITMYPNIALVQHGQRRVPIGLQEEIGSQLHKMVSISIITLEPNHTAWVSSLTYPKKDNGSICVCLDPKVLEKL